MTEQEAIYLGLMYLFQIVWILTLHWRIDELEKYVEEQKRKDDSNV